MKKDICGDEAVKAIKLGDRREELERAAFDRFILLNFERTLY
jgi:hypothetical protein